MASRIWITCWHISVFITTRMLKKFCFLSLLFISTVLFPQEGNETTPPGSNGFEICEMSISEFHDALRAGQVTCEELVQKYIERIEKYDDAINSIITINPEALNDAILLDNEFRGSGQLKPLHGVPFIVKDNFNTAGLQTTAGSILMKGFEPSQNAFAIQKILEAGGIILAKSNMAEWAISGVSTVSSISGETKNPYNLEYVPSGSTGGTAAAIAANFGLAGLGTDTGNSINGPASYTSLVGLRPTIGLVSRSGTVPLCPAHDTPGIMCRTVEDLARILDVIAGEDKNDPVTHHSKGRIPGTYLPSPGALNLKGVRIGVLNNLASRMKDTVLINLFRHALTDMEKLGAEIIYFSIPEFEQTRKNLWCCDFQYALNRYLKMQKGKAPLKNYSEIIGSGKYLESSKEFLIQNHAYDEDTISNINICPGVFASSRRTKFRRTIEKIMDDSDFHLIIYPTWLVYPAHVGQIPVFPGSGSGAISPLSGQPAMTVPSGFGSDNLPAGIQLLGRIFDEALLIEVAYIYEQSNHHRKPPELFPCNE